jgi:O-antigen ligase
VSAVLPLPLEGRERSYQGALASALFALGLFVPWSTAGTSLARGALALLYCTAPRRALLATPWREPAVVLGLALLAYIALRSMVAQDWAIESIKVANRYHELLMIPLLWALVQLSVRRNAFLYGLLLGAVGLAIAYWLPLPPQIEVKLELRRISTGFGLPVCAFLLYEEARLKRLPAWVGHGGAAFLAISIMAVVGSRTGYVMLLLLGACATWRTAPRRWRAPALMALLVLAATAFTVLSTVREPRGDIAVSNRIRTELVTNTVDVIREHWLAGTGWRGFGDAYAGAAASKGAEPGSFWAHSDNPHNEYLMQAAGGGLPALGLFLAWLLVPIVAPWRRHEGTNSQTGVLACIALAFAVGCGFNSMLLDFTEGHLYGALFAFLMAQRE